MGTIIRIRGNAVNNSLCTHSRLLYLVLFALALLPLSACSKGGGTEGKSEGGSIAFSIQFPGKTHIEPANVYSRAASFNCQERGIATIEADVYDGNDILIAEDGPWNCDAGEGIVSNIAPGENRRVVILCFNEERTLTYRGEIAGILVTQGETTDAGNIAVSPVNANHAPVLSAIGTKSEFVGSPIQFTISATDEDGDTLTYEMGNAPTANMSFDPATRQFSWTPSVSDAGEYKVLFIVHDDGMPRMSDYEEVTIQAQTMTADIPHYPVLAPIGPQLVNQGDILNIELQATDADPQSTFSYYGSPVNDKDNYPNPYDPNVETGLFTWDTTSVTPGNYYVEFYVYDNSDLGDTEEVTITVGDVNRPPVLTPIGCRWAQVGESLSFLFTATDPEGDDLTYTLEDPQQDYWYPTGASLDPSIQTFSWTIGDVSSGIYMVRIKVTDSHGESDFEDVMITVDGLLY